jgi:hypothetical protein
MNRTTQPEKRAADSHLPLRPSSGERELAAKPPPYGQSHQTDGFTRMETLFVVGVLALGALLILPELAKTTQRAAGTSCVNQLKSIGVAFRLIERLRRQESVPSPRRTDSQRLTGVAVRIVRSDDRRRSMENLPGSRE